MKRLCCLLAALFTAACLAGCGASNKSTMTEMATDSAPMAPSGALVGNSYATTFGGEGGSEVTLPQNIDRKIIYTADLNLESKDYAATRDQILAALAEVQGYVASSSEGGSADTGSRWVSYSLRVPADRYNAFLNTVSETGSLTSKSENTDDITGQYVDVEARLKALTAQRDRLNELADGAETTADLLEIESQLSDVQYQIESYTAQQRAYDDQIDYATVNVYLDEVQVYSPTTDSFLARLGTAFEGGWTGFVAGVQGVILALAYLWPGLIVLAVIIIVVWQLVVRAKRRRKAAWEAAQRQTPPTPPQA